MNMHNAALILDESLTTVKCRFRGGDLDYMFACRKDLAVTLEVGCLVVAHTTKGVSVVGISQIDDDSEIDANSNTSYDFVFQRVDMDSLADLNNSHFDSVINLKKMQRDRMRNEVRESIRNNLLSANTNEDVL